MAPDRAHRDGVLPGRAAAAPAGRGARRGRGAGRRHRASADDAPGRAPPHGGPDAAGRGPQARGGVPRGGVSTRCSTPRSSRRRGATPATRTSSSRSARSTSRRPPRRPACGTWCCARSRPSTERAGRTRASSPRRRGPDAGSRLAWVRDKVEAEEHAFSFARRYPGLGVTVLRFAPLLGPGRPHLLHALCSASAWCRCCSATTRCVQLLHPDDALDAAMLALEHGPARVVNVVPRAAMTLLTALHLADKVTVPVPHPAAYPLAELLVGRGRGRGARRLPRLRALPVRGRRREGAARARLRGALLEPRGARGVPGATAIPRRAGRRPRSARSPRPARARLGA